MKKIVLASKSPRRKELLKQIIDEFEIDVAIKPERKPFWVKKSKIAEHLAKQKAKEVFKKHKDAIVIGADTIVLAKNQILGKPKDEADVRRMINLLSGCTHQVITGVCVISNEKTICFSSVTDVTFVKMSEEEINEYCKLKTIYDKAGAYAIQAEAGKYISEIKGDYNNVVGLPIDELKKHLF